MKKRISLSQKKLINPQHLNLKQLFSSFKLTKSKKEISEIKKRKENKFNYPNVPSYDISSRKISKLNSSIIEDKDFLRKNYKKKLKITKINKTVKDIKLPFLDKSNEENYQNNKNSRNLSLPFLDKSINKIQKKSSSLKKNDCQNIKLNILSINSEIYIKFPKFNNINVSSFHEKIFEKLISIEYTYENLKKNYQPLEYKNLILNIKQFFQNIKEHLNEEIKDNIYHIFKQEKMNSIYKKIIKCVVFILTVFLFELNHFNESEMNIIHHIISSNGFGTLIEELFDIIYSFYSNYFPQKIINKNKDLDKKKIEKYQEIKKKEFDGNNLIYFIGKKTDKCVHNLSIYISVQLKHLMNNPFPLVITEIIKLYGICSIYYIDNLIINCIILPELNFLNLIYKTSNLYPILKKYHLKNEVNKNSILPNKNLNYYYTLVIDLDETLIHYFNTPKGGTFFLRPNCINFLNELSPLFEIIIFTASKREYADLILDKIENGKKYFQYRLYREHLNNYYKDLSKIGRDLNKTIIIDNLEVNYKLQPENGLLIKSWLGDDIFDMELSDLKDFLILLYHEKIPDVRVVVKNINESIKNSDMKRFYKNLDLNYIFNL